MIYVKLIAVTVLTCLLILLIKPYQPAISVLLSLAGICVLCLWCIQKITTVYEWLQTLSAGIPDSEFFTLLRCAGIAILTQMAKKLCDDCGQAALASATELAGRVMILLCSLPLLQTALSAILELLR